MKLAAGVKPDYIGENKPRTNLIFLSLDVIECLITHPLTNSDKIISNLRVTPLLRLIHLLDLLKAFSLCGVVPRTNRHIVFSEISPYGPNNFVGGLTLNSCDTFSDLLFLIPTPVDTNSEW